MEYSWEEPLCLIENSDEKGLQINEVTLAKLSKVKVPVSVVAIVGLYRTGKSYLMNLLAGSQSGFSLGSTVQSKTKGIWAWCRPHPSRKGQCLLLLDTEGLGDVEKGDKNHDTWVFALAVLLSSTLVYNSIGKIDQDALHDLHFVTEISEHVKIKSGTAEEDGTEFDAFFPHFIWAIRDFTLELELDGKSITSDEYLEHALTPKSGHGRKILEFNLPRDCIRNYFPTRKCFTFPQPVQERKMLKDLENLDTSELDPDFLAMSDRFVKHVCKQLKSKTIQGRAVTGSVMGNLAKCYVEAIQNGAVPCIQSAVETTAQLENAKAVHDSLELYRSMMVERIKLPTDTLEELSLVHQECEQATIAYFLKAAIFDSDFTFQKQMKDQVTREYAAFCKQNEEASFQACSQVLDSLYGTISAKVQSGEFAKPGGYELYKNEMNNLEKKYWNTSGKGVKASDVLNRFLQSKEVEGSNILAADKKLDEEQKKVEEEKMKAEEYKRQQLVAEEEKKQAEQQMIDQQKSYEENVKQLQEKMEKDKAALLEEQEAQLNKKIKEQEDMLKKGFKQQADALQKEVDRLKEEQRKQSQEGGGGFFGLVGKVLDHVIPISKIFSK